jgi:hypothetical protein
VIVRRRENLVRDGDSTDVLSNVQYGLGVALLEGVVTRSFTGNEPLIRL